MLLTNQALLFQMDQVLVHRCRRTELEPFANFHNARRIALGTDMLLEIIINLSLTFGEMHLLIPLYGFPHITYSRRKKHENQLLAAGAMSNRFIWQAKRLAA